MQIFFTPCIFIPSGDVAERLNARDSKSCIRYMPYQGFKSLRLRQIKKRPLWGDFFVVFSNTPTIIPSKTKGSNMSQSKKVSENIIINNEFDFQKNANFSLRTLLLLSVATIGILLFELNPKIIGIDVINNLKKFSLFMAIIISAQFVLALLSSKINKANVNQILSKFEIEKNEIIRKVENYKPPVDKWQKNIDDLKKITYENSKGRIGTQSFRTNRF